MQSSSTSYGGFRYYQDNNDPVPTVTAVPRGSRVFTVNNGLRIGDHKSPNPIDFTRTESFCVKNERTLWVKPQYGGGTQRWWGNDPSISPLNQSPSSSEFSEPYEVLYDRAMGKIYDQLRGKSEVVVDLLESAKTLRMIRASTRLVSGVGTVLDWIARDMRRNQHRGQRALDLVTGKWLEYSYGWMPLVNSVYDAFETLSREQTSEVRRIVARSGRRRETSRIRMTWGNAYGEYPAQEEMINSDRLVLCYDFDLRDTNKLWDWTSLNPATIAWELLPFSFVADWFVSVGDSLRQLENWWLYRNKFLRGYDTHTRLWYAERTINHVQLQTSTMSSGGYLLEKVVGERWWSLRYKNRRVRTSLPVPGGPRFRVKLGAEKCLSAAALLQQLVGRRSREWAVFS